MKTGRPTKYSNEILEKLKQYREDHKSGFYETRDYFTKGGKYKEKVVFNPNLARIDELSEYLGIHRSTFHEWEQKHWEFSDIVGRIRMTYRINIVNYGLQGLMSEKMAIFLYKRILKEDKRKNLV